MKNTPSNSSPEKNVLREVRRRYHLDPAQPHVAPAERSARPVSPSGRRTVRPKKARAGIQRSHHWGRKIALLVFLAVVLSGGIFGYKILAAGNRISTAEQSLLGQLKDLLFSSGEFLAGEQDGRINILLMAVGGEGHSGENLADTIMIASIRPETNAVALLSIPRDLYVQVPGEQYYSKINAVHAYGESKKSGQGPEVLRQSVESITGLPIHYYTRIDFDAFKSIVDTVGGVTITIDNSFEDYWHKIAFPAGTEKMNGERALAYVRARYVEGPEGGDFRRAARQQQVLLAMREKVFSVNTAFDFRAVNDILNALSDNIRTDLQIWEMKRFFELARQLDSQNVHSVVLTTGPNGVLVGGTEVLGSTPASVLRTRTGDFSEIQSIAANIFSDDVSKRIQPTSQPASETTEEPSSTQAAEEKKLPTAKVEIRNGTKVPGLAQKTSDKLTEDGYEVLAIGNASDQTQQETTVYVLQTTQADAGQKIAESLEASAGSTLPDGEKETSADILIILGQDAAGE
ncbi:MAG: LCP family protein [Candidatus Andersenbacteria bacterium]